MTHSNTGITPVDELFQFQGFQVRTAIDERTGDAWFCAKDVFDILEIKWSGTANSLRNIPETWRMVSYLETIQGGRETVFINEAAVYMVAFRSNKPKALAFSQWACGEVFPTLRKKGFYGRIDLKEQAGLQQRLAFWMDRLDTRDAARFAIALHQVNTLCDMLGTPRPDPTMVGKDRDQLPLFSQEGRS